MEDLHWKCVCGFLTDELWIKILLQPDHTISTGPRWHSRFSSETLTALAHAAAVIRYAYFDTSVCMWRADSGLSVSAKQGRCEGCYGTIPAGRPRNIGSIKTRFFFVCFLLVMRHTVTTKLRCELRSPFSAIRPAQTYKLQDRANKNAKEVLTHDTSSENDWTCLLHVCRACTSYVSPYKTSLYQCVASCT